MALEYAPGAVQGEGERGIQDIQNEIDRLSRMIDSQHSVIDMSGADKRVSQLDLIFQREDNDNELLMEIKRRACGSDGAGFEKYAMQGESMWQCDKPSNCEFVAWQDRENAAVDVDIAEQWPAEAIAGERGRVEAQGAPQQPPNERDGADAARLEGIIAQQQQVIEALRGKLKEHAAFKREVRQLVSGLQRAVSQARQQCRALKRGPGDPGHALRADSLPAPRHECQRCGAAAPHYAQQGGALGPGGRLSGQHAPRDADGGRRVGAGGPAGAAGVADTAERGPGRAPQPGDAQRRGRDGWTAKAGSL